MCCLVKLIYECNVIVLFLFVNTRLQLFYYAKFLYHIATVILFIYFILFRASWKIEFFTREIG